MKKARQASSKREKARPRRKNPAWLPAVLVVGGGLGLLFLIIVLLGQPGAQPVDPVRVGSPLSDFSLADLSGQKVQVSDYAGKVVLLNAWATWCPPCRAEMPALNDYYRQHASDGFIILAINAGETAVEAGAFVEEKGLAFPVLLDPQTRLLNGLNIRSFPTSVLVGRDGVVKDIHIGLLTPELIEAKIGPLLAQ